MQEKEAIRITNLSKRFYIPQQINNGAWSKLRSFFGEGSFYEPLWALQEINFSVKSGEFIAIVGENGAGKTTLLRLITGILKPTQGVIQVKGKVTPFFDLFVGFQDYLTADENAYFYSSIIGLSRQEVRERLNKVMDFAELERFRETKLRYFSYGMRSRLAFSLVMHSEPEILLLDEVVAVGDGRFKRKCFEALQGLKKEGRTVVMSTVWLSAARELCDRILVLEKGQQKAFGLAPEVLSKVESEMHDFFVAYKG